MTTRRLEFEGELPPTDEENFDVPPFFERVGSEGGGTSIPDGALPGGGGNNLPSGALPP